MYPLLCIFRTQHKITTLYLIKRKIKIQRLVRLLKKKNRTKIIGQMLINYHSFLVNFVFIVIDAPIFESNVCIHIG